MDVSNTLIADWDKMKRDHPKLGSKSGMKIINHYFSDVRDNTIVNGRHTIHQWIQKNRDKPYVKRLIAYKTKIRGEGKEDVYLREAFQIYSGGGAVRMFSPMVASWLYARYNARNILDFCAGWGGRCLGAMRLGINYTGIDTNLALARQYDQMIRLFTPHTPSKVSIYFGDAVNHIYPTDEYDMILTSPPYWRNETRLIEKYENMPEYKSKTHFETVFLRPIICKTWNALRVGGHYVISTQESQYEVFKSILGEPIEIFDYKKYGRQSEKSTRIKITEKDKIYCWKKTDGSE